MVWDHKKWKKRLHDHVDKVKRSHEGCLNCTGQEPTKPLLSIPTILRFKKATP